MKNSVRKKSNKNPKTRVFHPLLSSHCPSHPDTIMENFYTPFFFCPSKKLEMQSANLRILFFTYLFPTCFCGSISGFHHYPIHQPIKEGCSSLGEHNRGAFCLFASPLFSVTDPQEKYPKRSNLWRARERVCEILSVGGFPNRGGLLERCF